MEFAVFALPTYFPERNEPEAEYFHRMLDFLTLAEELGFDSIWVNEHHFHPYGGMIPSPPLLLAALAQRTSRARLGTSVVLLPLHNPLHMAEELAMVDLLSRGRLEVGFGRGFVAHDYEVHRIPVEEGQDRLLESVDILVKAWSRAPFSHRGSYYQFDDVEVWPRPQQEPHPPLWMAATANPSSFETIGQRGYNLLTVGYVKPMEDLAHLIDIYRAARAAAGYPADGKVGTHYQVVVDEDRDRALAVALKGVRDYVTQNREAQSLARNTPLLAHTAELSKDGGAHLDIEELIHQGRVLAGTPDDVVASLERIRDAIGTTSIDCTFTFGGISYDIAERSMRLFAGEVIPRLRTPQLAGKRL